MEEEDNLDSYEEMDPQPKNNYEMDSIEMDLNEPTPLQDPSSLPPDYSGNGGAVEEQYFEEPQPSPQYYQDYDYGGVFDGEDGQYSFRDADVTPPNTAYDDEETFPSYSEDEYKSFNGEDGEDNYGISVSKSSGQPTSLLKMKSPFSMSNQQILDLNDPFNQKAFEDNFTRLDHLLENTQKEYCSLHYNLPNPDDNNCVLSQQLLTKLIYKDELYLSGNFLQHNLGRRLKDSDMSELANFLMADQQVARLNLAYNDFGDDSAAALSAVLLERLDILHVNLAHNDFSPDACSQFFYSLMQRPPLHSLNMTGVKIGDESGRGPYDLDISETDLTMAAFQGLCTAWQCIDKNEDRPKFLVDNPLPIPLEVLAEMKRTNNEMKENEQNLMQRRSLGDLIRQDAGDMSTGLDKIPETLNEYADSPSQSRLLEKVSATILQGLFEIPEFSRLIQKTDPLEPTTLAEGQANIDAIVQETQALPPADELIEEYKKIRDAGCEPIDPTGRPVIVCPSLYSLDVEDYLEIDPLTGDHFIPTPLDELVHKAQELGKNDLKSGRAPDDDTARRAADAVMKRVVAEAATFSGKTDYGEKADATQILLTSVLSTCQRAIAMKNADGEFRDEDLEEIWDVATKETVNLIYNRIPPERCSLTPAEVVVFVRKFMETSNRTLLRLLQNPFIPPFILNAGTVMCKTADDEATTKCELDAEGNTRCEEEDEEEEGDNFSQSDWDSLGTNHVQKIVMSFLEGAVKSAATIIGGGDPFYFRSSEKERGHPLEDALKKGEAEADEAEEKVEGVIKDFFLAGAVLSVNANDIQKKLDESLDTAIDPAVEFLEETFDQVANLIIELDKRRNKDLVFEEKDVVAIKFPYASRPSRIICNRPLFQDFEAVMSAKMGDFLRLNTSVKCLHMRKWDLGEDGMISLMDGLSSNSHIVLLDLGCNAIGSEGIKGLAKFVQQNSSLKHLLLNNNRLRNPGLKYLYESFIGSSVEFLNISFNGIGEFLEPFLESLPTTKIRSLYVLGNKFNQASWLKLKYLFDTAWLLPEYCDVLLQEVDGQGIIVKNSQIRDMNEWYDVQPIVPLGLYRAPYFEETAHIDAINQITA